MRMSYQYSCLADAIDDKGCPLRQYLDRRFPDPGPVQAGYRAAAGTLLVDSGSASPRTVEATFNYLLRFTLDADYLPGPAISADPILDVPEYIDQVRAVAKLAGSVHTSPLPENTLLTVIRACWALALCTQLYRYPSIFPTSPLADPIRTGRFTVDTLLALAPEDAVNQLKSLYPPALVELDDLLTAPPATVTLDPTFPASQLCRTDADIIANGVLIGLTTRPGLKNRRTGQRQDSLPVTDIYQLVGYALFDTTDIYRIHTAALYSARYGKLHRWHLQELLDTLAGEPIDLAAERAYVWKLLGGRKLPRTGRRRRWP